MSTVTYQGPTTRLEIAKRIERKNSKDQLAHTLARIWFEIGRDAFAADRLNEIEKLIRDRL